MKARGIITAVMFVASAVYGMAGYTNIALGEAGIKTQMLFSGKGETTALSTGTQWVDPMKFDVETISTKYKPYDEGFITSGTNDGQPVEVHVTFQIGLVGAQVPELIENVGQDWYGQVFRPAAIKAIKDSSAAVSSDEIYTQAGREIVSDFITATLVERFSGLGIRFETNLQSVKFLNKAFVDTLEEKASAAQQEEIQSRYADAAEQKALKVEFDAEGLKLARIKAAEAKAEELRLDGEGLRDRDVAAAEGILALAAAEAQGKKLMRQALAGAGGAELVSIAWAENLGPNIKVYGVPTGAPGTSSFMFDQAMRGVTGNAAVAAAVGEKTAQQYASN